MDRKCSELTFRQADVSAAQWRHFRDVLTNTIDGGVHDLIIVFEDVHILFSGVLNALAEARVKTRDCGGTVVLVATSDELYRFFATTGFDKIFEIVDTIEEARALISKTTA